MKILLSHFKNQKGAATLLTSVILLIAITLVVILSAKTVLNETKIAASNYRISQASAAANYAMDSAIDYFNSGGFDQNLDDVVDNIHTHDINADTVNDEVRLTSSDGSQTTFATVSFTPDGTSWKSGLITATGFSDDRAATRTITQRVGPLGILINDGPSQPLVAQGNIALTGNARIINRFTNTTIWSGGDVKISSSSAMETYIKDPAVGTLDPADATDLARLLQIDEDIDTQLVSNNNLGNGLDIIDDDPSLGTLVGINFFKNFFKSETRAQLKIKAEPQIYNDIADAITVPAKSGLIWLEGNHTMNGGTIGSIAKPAIVYINGDFNYAGNSVIYGVLYVAGKYTIAGNPVVVGANVVEGTVLATETPASPPIVTGSGTISLVYWQGIFSDKKNPMDGQTAVISGSWRDW